MVRAAIAFFIIAVLAYVVGANGIAGMSMEVGKLFVWVFLALAGISLVVSLLTGKRPNPLP